MLQARSDDLSFALVKGVAIRGAAGVGLGFVFGFAGWLALSWAFFNASWTPETFLLYLYAVLAVGGMVGLGVVLAWLQTRGPWIAQVLNAVVPLVAAMLLYLAALQTVRYAGVAGQVHQLTATPIVAPGAFLVTVMAMVTVGANVAAGAFYTARALVFGRG